MGYMDGCLVGGVCHVKAAIYPIGEWVVANEAFLRVLKLFIGSPGLFHCPHNTGETNIKSASQKQFLAYRDHTRARTCNRKVSVPKQSCVCLISCETKWEEKIGRERTILVKTDTAISEQSPHE